MQTSYYSHAMANLQVRNMADDLHERLPRHARENSCTMSAAVLTAVERELARWEWRKRLAQLPRADLGVDDAAMLVEERSLRDMETGRAGTSSRPVGGRHDRGSLVGCG